MRLNIQSQITQNETSFLSLVMRAMWYKYCVHITHNYMSLFILMPDQNVRLPEEVARDVELLATNNYNFVSFQQDLSNNCGQAAQQMATAIDNYGL